MTGHFTSLHFIKAIDDQYLAQLKYRSELVPRLSAPL
jgi:hypothetical protein